MNAFENIPLELTDLDQWVVVDAESKCPLNPINGNPASPSNPESWGSFDQATRVVEAGDAGNIGFVFRNNGLVGIDIDIGYDEDGFLSPEAVDILKRCESYSERSRSGRGFHIILRGTLPFAGKNNRKGLEIYRDARYFITTGDVLLFHKVIENQEAIDYIVETYFAEEAKKGDGASKGFRIYTPEWESPKDGEKIRLRPRYPEITSGSRNISMTSLAGQMHSVGYNAEEIYKELCYANKMACKPQLDESELETITRSVTRYER